MYQSHMNIYYLFIKLMNLNYSCIYLLFYIKLTIISKIFRNKTFNIYFKF